MEFRDAPNLKRFADHARANDTCEITMDAYRRVRDLIAPVPAPAASVDVQAGVTVESMKETLAAIEKSNRIIWACAAATDCVTPAIWEYTPDYNSALEYFQSLDDLELMAITKNYRISWEQTLQR
jgi:hypothetical protein